MKSDNKSSSLANSAVTLPNADRNSGLSSPEPNGLVEFLLKRIASDGEIADLCAELNIYRYSCGGWPDDLKKEMVKTIEAVLRRIAPELEQSFTIKAK